MQGRVNGMPVDFVLDTGAERTAITPELATRRPASGCSGRTLAAGVGSAAVAPRSGSRAWTRWTSAASACATCRCRCGRRRPAARPRWQSQTLVAAGARAVGGGGLPREAGCCSARDPRRRRPIWSADARAPAAARARHAERRDARRHFIVDTGGEVISLNADVADSLDLRPARRIPLRVYGLEGLDESAFLLPGVDLDVGVDCLPPDRRGGAGSAVAQRAARVSDRRHRRPQIPGRPARVLRSGAQRAAASVRLRVRSGGCSARVG